VTESASSWAEGGIDLVDPTLDATDMVLGDFVAHGVGQGFDWRWGADGVAVQVQERVQLDERQSTVTTQDGHTRRAERPAADVGRVGAEGAQGWVVERGGSAAMTLGCDGPELVAELIQLGGRRHALVVEGDQLPIDAAQGGE
jgi:hypothetical protein